MTGKRIKRVETHFGENVGTPLESLFETIHGFQRTAALKTALELEIFTSIADGTNDVISLAQRSEASERGIGILCDYLASLGLLRKTEDRYELTGSSAVLNKKSPKYIGGAAEFLISQQPAGGFPNLTAAIRQGGVPGGEGVATSNPPSSIMRWVEFAHAMEPLMVRPANLLADLLAGEKETSLKVLDIAAGHGLFGIAVAKCNPRASITAVDWPDVVEIARENARIANVSGRFSAIPGNAFEVDYGSGYDLALLVNFLHHFDLAACQEICRKVYRALNNRGRAAIVDFIPNEDRVSPRIAVEFSMTMLLTTGHGRAHTHSDYDRVLRHAGFASSTMQELPRTALRLVLAHK